jgi:hypothetical protein
MLHIHCGDSSAEALRKSGSVKGDIAVWSDVLWDGLCPPVADDEFRKIRAAFLSESIGGAHSAEACLRKLERQDAALESAEGHDELVLWFDACLYDQLILIRLLQKLSLKKPSKTKISLICAGEFPGFVKFRGLGELSPEQMASLFPGRQPVSDAMFAAAAKIWAAFTAGTPEALAVVAKAPEDYFGGLKYARAAVVRFLECYPSRNGLERLENEILKGLSGGEKTFMELFRAVSDMEERPFFGDTSLSRAVNIMAALGQPPLSIESGVPFSQWNPPPEDFRRKVKITPFGLSLLSGGADNIAANGVRRSLGGVTLSPSNLWIYESGGLSRRQPSSSRSSI